MEKLITEFDKLSIQNNANDTDFINQLVKRFDQLTLNGTIKENKKYLQMIFFSLEPLSSLPQRQDGCFQSREDYKIMLVQANLYLVKGGLCPVMETKSFNQKYIEDRVQTYLEKQKDCLRKPKKVIPIFKTEDWKVVLVWMPGFRNLPQICEEGKSKITKSKTTSKTTSKAKSKIRSKLRKTEMMVLTVKINRQSLEYPYPQYWLNQLNWNPIPQGNKIENIVEFITRHIKPEEHPELIDYLIDVPYPKIDFKKKFRMI